MSDWKMALNEIFFYLLVFVIYNCQSSVIDFAFLKFSSFTVVWTLCFRNVLWLRSKKRNAYENGEKLRENEWTKREIISFNFQNLRDCTEMLNATARLQMGRVKSLTIRNAKSCFYDFLNSMLYFDNYSNYSKIMSNAEFRDKSLFFLKMWLFRCNFCFCYILNHYMSTPWRINKTIDLPRWFIIYNWDPYEITRRELSL